MEIQPQLVSELLAQLQTVSVSVADQGQGAVTDSKDIETPYLQLVMTRLWDSEAAQGSRRLRLDTLHQLGEAKHIVSTHLDTVMAGLSEDQRDIAANVFRYLVTPSGTKISYTAKDLAVYAGGIDPAKVESVLEQLAAGRGRVLRPVPPPLGSSQSARYEIFHDVMAPAVLDWRRRYGAEQSEASLVREKQEAENRHRATRRRLYLSRILSAALAILLVITFLSLKSANNSARAAKKSERMTQQATLLAQYGEALKTDPAAALDFALQAWNKENTPAAETAIRTALDADTERIKVQADGGQLIKTQFSPDGRNILTAGTDGIAKVFDATSGRRVLSFEPSASTNRPELMDASYAPDGRLLLTVTSTGQVRLYNAESGADLGLLSEKTGGRSRPRPIREGRVGARRPTRCRSHLRRDRGGRVMGRRAPLCYREVRDRSW